MDNSKQFVWLDLHYHNGILFIVGNYNCFYIGLCCHFLPFGHLNELFLVIKKSWCNGLLQLRIIIYINKAPTFSWHNLGQSSPLEWTLILFTATKLVAFLTLCLLQNLFILLSFIYGRSSLASHFFHAVTKEFIEAHSSNLNQRLFSLCSLWRLLLLFAYSYLYVLWRIWMAAVARIWTFNNRSQFRLAGAWTWRINFTIFAIFLLPFASSQIILCRFIWIGRACTL